MKYDVFLVSAMADLEKADQITRRLRTLKFKVRFDKKREHTTPTPKDIKDANESKAVLVLWSKTACNTELPDSDWVHAMAHQARSRPDVLIQGALDRSKPDEPFDTDKRYSLMGLAPRKVIKGFNSLADTLGERLDRPGLGDWLSFTSAQREEKAAWKEAHAEDPLSKPPAKKTTTAKTPASPKKIAAENTPSASTARPKASPLKLNPPVAPSPPVPKDPTDRLMLASVAAGILFLFLFSYGVRSQTNGLPAIGNAGPILSERCPPGQVPADMVTPPPLAHGEIIDDTEE